MPTESGPTRESAAPDLTGSPHQPEVIAAELQPAPQPAPAPASDRRAPLRRIIIGSALGAAALWLSLRGVDTAELGLALAETDPVLGLAALTSTIGALLAVVARWKALFGPDSARLTFGVLFRSMVVGQALNILVPIRLGEIARLYGVARHTRVPAGRVLASLALEKVFELGTFGTAAALAAAWMAVPGNLPGRGTTRVALAGAALVLFVVFSRFGPPVAGFLAGRLTWLPGAIRRRLESLSHDFAAGLRALDHPAAWMSVLVTSIVSMALAAGANYLLFRAMGLTLPIHAALVLLLVLQVGSVPPSLPGRIGVFNYLTVLTLGFYGVDRATALGYSVVLYAIAYLPKVLLGAVFLSDRSWRPGLGLDRGR